MTPEQYIKALPQEQQEPIEQIRKAILDHLPKGFEETISYNMIGYVVPKTLYPNGYHCNPDLPLPFIHLAAQKNNISLYHMGLYADEELKEWFMAEYPNHSKRKLNMGKSCIRFKYTQELPLELLGSLISKMSVKQWISIYEAQLLR